MSREKLSFAQEACVRGVGKDMQQAGMLWPGCRVGVAVSGGVDSFVLLQCLRLRQRIVPFHFELWLCISILASTPIVTKAWCHG